MSYTAPTTPNVNFTFQGQSAYTAPTTPNVNFAFPADTYTGTGAVTLGLSAAAVAEHGVAGAGATTITGLDASGAGSFTSNTDTGAGDVTISGLDASGVVAHGVAGAGTGTLAGVDATAQAEHGVAGAGTITLGDLSAVGQAAHGVSALGDGSLSISVDGAGIVYRYEVRGQVQQGGVLINRHVRVYRRDTGELVGEGDTALGKFQITTGFAQREHYVVPVNLADDATDWTPPVANRVNSVLAQD